MFLVGDDVYYWSSDKVFEPAKIKAIHHDDITPYYTILLNGREKQTVAERLTSKLEYSKLKKDIDLLFDRRGKMSF
jgi:hypothetical protein